MVANSKLAGQIAGKNFIVTVEYQPPAGTDAAAIERFVSTIGNVPTAINVADNHYGVAMSSLGASLTLMRFGEEPVLQMVTRDRNRIALQSDLLSAAALGIKNVLCLSGYHQTLIGSPGSANVFDIDSIQLIAMVKKMNGGQLLEGTRIDGPFSMLIGAVANPYLKPLELSIIRLAKKVSAGADFIQTQAVFDIAAFQAWFEVVRAEGIADKAAILAGVLLLKNAEEARKLREAYTDFVIPDALVERLTRAGNAEAQQKEGLAIGAETVKKLRAVPGLRGVHILSGGADGQLGEILGAINWSR